MEVRKRYWEFANFPNFQHRRPPVTFYEANTLNFQQMGIRRIAESFRIPRTPSIPNARPELLGPGSLNPQPLEIQKDDGR